MLILTRGCQLGGLITYANFKHQVVKMLLWLLTHITYLYFWLIKFAKLGPLWKDWGPVFYNWLPLIFVASSEDMNLILTVSWLGENHWKPAEKETKEGDTQYKSHFLSLIHYRICFKTKIRNKKLNDRCFSKWGRVIF